MRVVHLSDWHGDSQPLPGADLYVVTGDMLPNFCTYKYDTNASRPRPENIVEYHTNLHLIGEKPEKTPRGAYVGRITDPLREVKCQTKYIELELEKDGFRRHLGTPGAQVLLLRGNHDFVSLSPWFAGGPTFEFGFGGTVLNFMGHKIDGTRGINYIYGEWSDEFTETQWRDAFSHISDDCDMLLTHAPPRNILDHEGHHYGSDTVASYVNRRMLATDHEGAAPLRAHFFGHVHASNGSKNIGGTLFSNAATTYIVYDI